MFGFGGQWGGYTDAQTGLVLCTHRDYDPGSGRFLTRDPLGYRGGLNLYAYTANNPVNRADPSGYGFHEVGVVQTPFDPGGGGDDEDIGPVGPGGVGGATTGGGGGGGEEPPLPSPGGGGYIYRGGSPTSIKTFTPRPVDEGMLSCRDTLSDPIDPSRSPDPVYGISWGGNRPVFPKDSPVSVIDPTKLPIPIEPIYDGGTGPNLPFGHVSIGPYVPPEPSYGWGS